MVGLVYSTRLVCRVYLVNETYQMSQINQINKTNQIDQTGLTIRWPRVYSGSNGYLDPRDPLHVGAEITETGGD